MHHPDKLLLFLRTPKEREREDIGVTYIRTGTKKQAKEECIRQLTFESYELGSLAATNFVT